jgi:diguanylate cyclase (GGDEF)-like protein
VFGALAGASRSEPGIVYTRDHVAERLLVMAVDAQGCVHVGNSGRSVAFADRAVLSPLANVRIPAALGEAPPVAVVADTKALRPWVEQRPESQFRRAAAGQWVLLGAFACVLVLLLLVGLGLLLWQRRVFVVAYVAYMVTLIFYQLQALGLGPAWIPFWPGPEHARLMQALATALVAVGVGTVVLTFLQPRQRLSQIIVAGTLLTSASFLSAAWTTWGYRLGALALTALAGLVLLLLARYPRTTDSTAPRTSPAVLRWFAAGLAASILGGGLQASSILADGAAPPGMLSVAFPIGNLVESLCWLVALSLHLRALQQTDSNRRWAAAHRDTVTGLNNQHWLREQIAAAIRQAERQPAAQRQLLLLDIDRFRDINALCGHAGGDAVLRQLGTSLRQVLEAGESLSRFSGDELVVLLRPGQDACAAEGRAAALLAKLAEPLHCGERELRLRGSIGIVAIHGAYVRPEEVIADAAIAVEAARDAGGHRAERFLPSVRRALTARERLRNELHTALRAAPGADGFLLHYQPVLALDGRRPVGFEALLRWQHPRRGMLPATAFVSETADPGLLRPLGYRVLHLACAQLRSWQRDGGWYRGEHLGINLSAAQLGDEQLLVELRRAVDDYGIDPSALRIEIPATALARETKDIARWRERLAGQQILLCLDGFGGDLAPLSALAEMAFDSIKLDCQLSAGVASQGRAQNLVQAGVALGHQFGCLVIAKGIESRAQAEQFKQLGCPYGQGDYLAPAMAAGTLDDWMRLWQGAGLPGDAPLTENRLH